ncbi:MAG: type II toxin-antitoxin system RelE family toxin [Pseudonocardia sp.]
MSICNSTTPRILVTRGCIEPDTGITKLVGSHGDWRVRIGEHRTVYELDDVTATVTIMRVQHRRDVYQ